MFIRILITQQRFGEWMYFEKSTLKCSRSCGFNPWRVSLPSVVMLGSELSVLHWACDLTAPLWGGCRGCAVEFLGAFFFKGSDGETFLWAVNQSWMKLIHPLWRCNDTWITLRVQQQYFAFRSAFSKSFWGWTCEIPASWTRHHQWMDDHPTHHFCSSWLNCNVKSWWLKKLGRLCKWIQKSVCTEYACFPLSVTHLSSKTRLVTVLLSTGWSSTGPLCHTAHHIHRLCVDC